MLAHLFAHGSDGALHRLALRHHIGILHGRIRVTQLLDPSASVNCRWETILSLASAKRLDSLLGVEVHRVAASR